MLAYELLRRHGDPTVLFVYEIDVEETHRRHGIGTALMDWAHDQAQASGYPEVRVGVRRQLPGNLRFYEKLGYRVIAEHRHPGYSDVTWIELKVLKALGLVWDVKVARMSQATEEEAAA